MSSPSDILTGDRLRDALDRRQSTVDLIADQGMPIQLLRASSAPVPDGAGGFVNPSPEDDPQPLATVRRLFMISLYEPPAGSQSAQGFGVHEKFVLIGTYDDDIEVDDEFYVGGQKYKVAMIHQDRTYQTKAEGEGVSGG